MYEVSKRRNPYWFYIGTDAVVEVFAHGHKSDEMMILDVVFSSVTEKGDREQLLLTRIESRKDVIESLPQKITYALEHPIFHGGAIDPGMTFHYLQDQVRRKDLYTCFTDFNESMPYQSRPRRDIYLNPISLKVERENAQAMIEGFMKDGKKHFVSIFTAHQHAWSLRKDFRKQPKLLTVKHGDPKPEYPLSEVGLALQQSNYRHRHNYIAQIDTIFELKSNNMHMWERLCNMGLFDIWKPEAPFNNLSGKEKPMILLLRIYRIKQNLSGKIEQRDHADKINVQDAVTVILPVIRDWEFEQLKTKLRLLINDQLKEEESVQDTCKLGYDTRETLYRCRKGKILICADRDALGGLISELCEQYEYYTAVVDTVDDYSELIQEEIFDVAILTNNMFPSGNIPEMIRSIREYSKDVSIIVASGWNSSDFIDTLRHVDIDAYYQMPFDIRIFIRDLNEIFSVRSRREYQEDTHA